MPGGSVRKLLDRFGVFEEKIIFLYATQMMRGLEFLHANGVAHRDIKVELGGVYPKSFELQVLMSRSVLEVTQIQPYPGME